MVGSGQLVRSSPRFLGALVHFCFASSGPASIVTVPAATLSNGQKLPLVGLGCSSGIRQAHVLSALELGYRHFDTAQAYRWGYQEHEVGNAVSESGIRREDIFLQTKIDPEDLGYEETKKAFLTSLKRLRSSYLDSVLIHKPRCWEGACSRVPAGTWHDSWKALEEFYEAGMVRAIGICDVDDGLLDELLQKKHKPHIIQNWMAHPGEMRAGGHSIPGLQHSRLPVDTPPG
eukprot:gnl/TRDRNA2_/TRDRNA2_168898_c1_seq3.p1 gnl/TRDRNA2_/TRDRNA2_168898_c1~~gnl/TRDRNA2_/TRDRNA2_168898_c1_seq3.p1  ORF type:complete len:231 (+),score=32.08 gnl/TRDRNA2_/TRDRNA2_168898_c1_seq3:62-754(+)